MADAPTPIRDPKKDVIHGNALRLTWISGAIGGIAAIITVFDDSITKIFGNDVTDGIRASVLIAIIAAWALIAVADLLARAIATAARARGPEIATLHPDIHVKLLESDGREDTGWLAVAVKADPTGGEPEYLVVKAHQPAEWVTESKFKVTATT